MDKIFKHIIERILHLHFLHLLLHQCSICHFGKYIISHYLVISKDQNLKIGVDHLNKDKEAWNEKNQTHPTKEIQEASKTFTKINLKWKLKTIASRILLQLYDRFIWGLIQVYQVISKNHLRRYTHNQLNIITYHCLALMKKFQRRTYTSKLINFSRRKVNIIRKDHTKQAKIMLDFRVGH